MYNLMFQEKKTFKKKFDVIQTDNLKSKIKYGSLLKHEQFGWFDIITFTVL